MTGGRDPGELEWAVNAPLLPDAPRGVARADDLRLISSNFYNLRTGARLQNLPEGSGPRTTVYDRYSRWGKAGIWLHIVEVLSEKSLHALHLIGGSIVRTHQHAAREKVARITP